MSEYGDKYTDLMAPAFVDGLSEIHGQVYVDGPSVVNIFSCQEYVKKQLAKIDWEASGLPPHSFDIAKGTFGEKDLTAGEYAERLMSFAFSDAYELIKLCEDFAEAHTLPDDTTLGQLLRNGKQSLLTIAGLRDNDKSTLIHALKMSHSPEIAEALLRGYELDDEPFVIETGRNQRPRLVWNTKTKSWIDSHTNPDNGCPALKHSVSTPDGRKQVLIYYFWDKIIEAAYLL